VCEAREGDGERAKDRASEITRERGSKGESERERVRVRVRGREEAGKQCRR
jgi:hypothetical protein